MMRSPRLHSRSCRVVKLVSGMRLEHLEMSLLGGCEGGDGYRRICELPQLPEKRAMRQLSMVVEWRGQGKSRRTNW